MPEALLHRWRRHRPCDLFHYGTRPPRLAIAPKTLNQAGDAEDFEPDLEERSKAIRALQRLDVNDPAKVAAYCSRWGWLAWDQEGWDVPDRFVRVADGWRSEPVLAASGKRFERGLVTVHFAFPEKVAEKVTEYREALELGASLRRLKGDARADADQQLDRIIASQLEHHVSEREPARPFRWLVLSPLGSAWQALSEDRAEGVAPQLCAWCSSAFTALPTDRRRKDAPPAYCSAACRVAMAKKRQREGKAPGEPGRSSKRRRGKA